MPRARTAGLGERVVRVRRRQERILCCERAARRSESVLRPCSGDAVMGLASLEALTGCLRYVDGRLACPLPGWAAYLMGLGADAAGFLTPQGHRLVVGVSLPTRQYVAALLAVGATVLAYERSEHDPRAHFDELAALPEGTPLRLVQGRHLYCGHLVGQEERDGLEYLVLAGIYGQGGLYLRQWDRCADIAPVEEGGLAPAPAASGARRLRGGCHAWDRRARMGFTDGFGLRDRWPT